MEFANSLDPLYEKTYGALYLATLLSTGLYGVAFMQTFHYYVHYPNDSLRMKSLVGILWALDTIHEALIITGAYKYIIAGLESPFGILEENPELAILSEALVSGPVQAFFVYRIYTFSGRHTVILLLWAVQETYQIVAAILYVVKAFYSVNGELRVVGAFVLTDRFFSCLTTSLLSINVVVDVLIAVAMTCLLLRMQHTVGFERTVHILQRLTMFAVNTGTWTALFAILSLILLRLYPSTFLIGLPSVPLSSLYCNTLLANLNARAYMRVGETTPLCEDATAKKRNEVVFNSPIHQTEQVLALVDNPGSAKHGGMHKAEA